MDKTKVGAVNYLNTKPLLFGIENSEIKNDIELITDYPANIAKALLNNTIDVGLVPIAILPKLNPHYLVTNFCIGATQAVASVAIFSQVPLQEISTILLDYQSRTSVALAKILLQHHFKKEVAFVEATENFIEEIKGTTAALVIGDRALKLRSNIPFIYDLAEEWIKFTQLPFVFAAWVANKKISEIFLEKFNTANALGLKNVEEVIAQNPYPYYDLGVYYNKNISYNFDEEKRKGLNLFLSYL